MDQVKDNGNPTPLAAAVHAAPARFPRFHGGDSARMDDKLRISVPMDLRRILQHPAFKGESDKIELLMTIANVKGHICIAVYPRAVWEAKLNELEQQVLHNPNLADTIDYMSRQTLTGELDDQGRLRLFKRQVDAARLRKELMVIGARGRVEIWDDRRFEEYTIQEQNQIAGMRFV